VVIVLNRALKLGGAALDAWCGGRGRRAEVQDKVRSKVKNEVKSKVKSKVENKIKGNGQECPFYTV
jgi:hypothetical protein